jgi:hypothetical protein
MTSETAQPEGLISVLLDQNAEVGDRDDAAMDLGSFDGPDVEAALLQVLLDHKENEILVETAAISFGELWIRSEKKNFDIIIDKMHPEARRYFSEFFSKNSS